MNKFVKTVSYDKVGYEFLRSLNGLLDLTDRQIELLSIFLDINANKQKSKKGNQAIDSADNRRTVMSLTGITKDNLCRYIKSFREKKIFIKEMGILSINKALVPILIGNKVVQITMILKINNDNVESI